MKKLNRCYRIACAINSRQPRTQAEADAIEASRKLAAEKLKYQLVKALYDGKLRTEEAEQVLERIKRKQEENADFYDEARAQHIVDMYDRLAVMLLREYRRQVVEKAGN